MPELPKLTKFLDIRIYPELNDDFWIPLFEQTAILFRVRLIYGCDYSLARYNHVYFAPSPKLRPGEIVATPSYPDWQYCVTVGVPFDTRPPLADARAFVINLIADTLAGCAQASGADPAPIEALRQDALTNGEDTVVWLESKFHSTKKYSLRPYFKVKGYRTDTMQLFVRITDLSNNSVADPLVAETAHVEAVALIGSFLIKNDNLIVRPRQGANSQYYVKKYACRGFQVPMEFPLSRIFSSA